MPSSQMVELGANRPKASAPPMRNPAPTGSDHGAQTAASSLSSPPASGGSWRLSSGVMFSTVQAKGKWTRLTSRSSSERQSTGNASFAGRRASGDYSSGAFPHVPVSRRGQVLVAHEGLEVHRRDARGCGHSSEFIRTRCYLRRPRRRKSSSVQRVASMICLNVPMGRVSPP